ncbi:MAG: Asp-tRNA(Asn)/Glu-tRNA(Gln) amidotransferase subunit GatA [Alphaproteobacteria bacterium]|jgi:aspartyl/glutamyl-tRNA(asn/gln) amidotransferase, A subunit|uniref:Asp-tRNA(Asn)/Glu-tRNA(Gln) amidotransferase subunit GatA n=1 Tax=Candidatus Scatocola faecigallinarum TaxID=2840916 RepID=UPI0003364288|nr:glutamyl-tRNA(Gln) amidotransferase subunit A [Azospirillum sp. CAG:239]
MTDLTKLTITEALKGLKEKKFSAVELTKEYLNKMESSRELNAYVLETPEKALEQAKAADEKYKNGTNGALEGIPLGIKDLFCTRGIRTTACSHILDGFVPPYESTVTQKLLDAGAVFLGKLNMDEFAMGGSNETSFYGPAVNPWSKDKKLVAGGSSGGSAAAVAANICAAATGTDTGGSIRQPSAFCGVTGIKPTYGRCSRYGIIAFASSLDQAGPIAKDVRDCAVMLKNMAGHDVRDSTSAKAEVPDFEKFIGMDVRGMKIGIPAEYRPDGLNAEIAAVWDRGIEMLKARGADIVDISLPHTKYALATYYIIAPAEASSNLARYDGLRYGLRVPGEHLDNMYINSRTEGFGKEVKRRIMIGTYVLSAGYYDAYYLKAQKVRRLIRDDFVKAFEKCDVILTPTAPSPAFPIGDKSMLENPINMYLNDVFTVSVSLAGLPAMSLPAGLSAEGLPLGLQVIGKAFDEGSVFKTASALEEDIKFERK